MQNELNIPQFLFFCLNFAIHVYYLFCRGPFMVSRLREFLMDHGHEDLIGRLQRGKSIHSNLQKSFDLIFTLILFQGK